MTPEQKMKSDAEARIGIPDGALHDKLPLVISARLVSFRNYVLCSCVDMGDTVVVGLKGVNPASEFRIYEGTRRGSTYVTMSPVGFLLKRNYSTLSLGGYLQSRIGTPYNSGKSLAAFIDDDDESAGIKSEDVLSIYLVLRGYEVGKVGYRGAPITHGHYMVTYDRAEDGKYPRYSRVRNCIMWEPNSVKEINVDNPTPFAL